MFQSALKNYVSDLLFCNETVQHDLSVTNAVISVFSEAERKVCGGVNYPVHLLDINLWNLKYDISIINVSEFFADPLAQIFS